MKGNDLKSFAYPGDLNVGPLDEFNPELFENLEGAQQIDPDAVYNGRQLRKLRRSRGLSQVELAELLGVTQPNVSRWEAGFERTPVRIQEQLKDILTGRNPHAADFFTRSARSDPTLSAHQIKQFSLPILKLSDNATNMLSQSANAYLGQDFRRVFQTEWFDDLFQGCSLSDFALVHINHDLVPDEVNPRIPAVRVDSLLYIFEPTEGDHIILARGQYSRSTGAPPELRHAISLDDL